LKKIPGIRLGGKKRKGGKTEKNYDIAAGGRSVGGQNRDI